MFEFEYTMTKEDYLRYNEYHFLNSKSGKTQIKRYRWTVGIVAAVMFAFAVYYTVELGFDVLVGALLMLGAVSGVCMIFGKKIIMRNLKKAVDKAAADGKAPYGYKSAISFKDEYIECISELKETKIRYGAIEKVCSSDDAVYIYIEALQALVLPERVFADEAQKRSLLEFVGAKRKTA